MKWASQSKGPSVKTREVPCVNVLYSSNEKSLLGTCILFQVNWHVILTFYFITFLLKLLFSFQKLMIAVFNEWIFYLFGQNFNKKILYVYSCFICMYVWTTCVPSVCESQVGPSKTGVSYSYEMPWGCWKLNQGPLQKQAVLLITEPCLQLLDRIFKNIYFMCMRLYLTALWTAHVSKPTEVKKGHQSWLWLWVRCVGSGSQIWVLCKSSACC